LRRCRSRVLAGCWCSPGAASWTSAAG
jgi:hypothetical protein